MVILYSGIDLVNYAFVIPQLTVSIQTLDPAIVFMTKSLEGGHFYDH